MKCSLAFYFLFILLAACNISCSNSSSSQNGSGSSSSSGSMTGFVSLFDSTGTEIANASSVTVSLQGTSFSTTTDTLGRWTISGVMTGTYTILYSKPGFGMTEQQGIQFVGGGLNYYGSVQMAQPPTFSIGLNPLKSFSDSSEIILYYSLNTSSSTEVVFIFGKNKNINPSDPTTYLYSTAADAYYNGSTTNYAALPASELLSAGFALGSTVYIVAYPSGYFFSNYYDIASGHTVFTSLGAPSNMIELTIQ